MQLYGRTVVIHLIESNDHNVVFLNNSPAIQVDPARRVKTRPVCLHDFTLIAFDIFGWQNPKPGGGLNPL